MQLWIDNTGLHSASLAANGKARGRVDCRGLLQLCTLLVFADRIKLNGFEPRFVADPSREAVSEFNRLIDEEVLKVVDVPESAYRMACEEAASGAAAEVSDSFQLNEDSILGPLSEDFIHGLEPEIPDRHQQAVLGFGALLKPNVEAQELENAATSSLEQKAVGAVALMVASSPGLRSALLAKTEQWEQRDLLQLAGFLRARLNSVLSEQLDSKYTPAVARASQLRRRSDFLLSRFTSHLQGIAEDLRGRPLPFPSVATALMERSRGEPKALIREVSQLRTATSDLRQWLADNLKLEHETPRQRYELDTAIRDLLAPLREQLQLTKRPELRDAVEIGIDTGVPSAGISPGALFDWASSKVKRRRLAVLTDLSIDAAFSDDDEALFRRLVRKCSL